jgi:hypothetical protein
MKELFKAAPGRNANSVVEPLSDRFTWRRVPIFYLGVLLSIFLFTGCKKQDVSEPASDSQLRTDKAINAEPDLLTQYRGLEGQTLWELQQARAATARYRDINNAFADGYADINVVVPNMGYHFMKPELVDATFDIRKPEILVYNKNEDGSFTLGAVEYAVPIGLSPNAAPEGFTGSADVWERDTNFGLWLQHAWVWTFNPDGVFNPTNPRVQVH